jgi:hypothetical protein
MTATEDDEVWEQAPEGHVYGGEHVYDMDEGDPEMEAWFDRLHPAEQEEIHQEVEEGGVPHQAAGPVWEEDPSTIWRCYDHWPHEEDYDKHTYSDGNAKCEVCGKRNFSVKPFTLR